MAINKSISSGLVPPCLKEAKIIPIFKANDPTLYSNYRPISILPTLSKILEKVIHKRLYGYMNSNSFFYIKASMAIGKHTQLVKL